MTESHAEQIEALDDRQVTLALEKLSFELRSQLSVEVEDVVRDEQEARQLLRSAAELAGEEPGVVDRISPRGARQLLMLAASDPEIGPIAAPIIANPPNDRHMDISPLIQEPLILGAAVSFLLTRIRVRIQRHEGKTNFDIDVTKQAASPEVVREYLDSVVKSVGGG